MSKEEPTSSPLPPRSIGPIQEPTLKDVLSGRGGDAAFHKGNLQMRGYCVEVREEYKHAKKLAKSAIASRVVQRVRSEGGRFLKRDSDTEMWWDIGDEQAKKKVSQVLRESTPDKEAWELSAPSANILNATSSISVPLGATPHWMHAVSMGPQQAYSTDGGYDKFSLKRKIPTPPEARMTESSLQGNVNHSSQQEGGLEESSLFKDMFGDFLSWPRFTNEQERRERENLTEEERVSVLSDLFGDACQISPSKKRVVAKGNLQALDDLASAARLLEMKSELEAIPAQEKRALTEAMAKCSPSEFNDDRMMLFLQRENMDPKLAAARFARYWSKRRQLFAEKFHLPITLAGALRDDLTALAQGVLSIVPKHDAFGRPIMIHLPLCNVRNGYDRDSMLRAAWYMCESLLDDEHARNGIVLIFCFKGVTLFDYDRELDEGFLEFEREYLPLKFRALHGIGIHNIVVQLIKPVAYALMDKDIRLRMVLTPLVDDAACNHLKKYGLNRDVIPVELGGECHVNHKEWLAKQREIGK